MILDEPPSCFWKTGPCRLHSFKLLMRGCQKVQLQLSFIIVSQAIRFKGCGYKIPMTPKRFSSAIPSWLKTQDTWRVVLTVPHIKWRADCGHPNVFLFVCFLISLSFVCGLMPASCTESQSDFTVFTCWIPWKTRRIVQEMDHTGCSRKPLTEKKHSRLQVFTSEYFLYTVHWTSYLLP